MKSVNEYGIIDIKDRAIKEIVLIAIKKTKFVRPCKKDLSFINVKTKNNNLQINVNVNLKDGKDIIKVTSCAQKNIADALSDFTSANVTDVTVSVIDFYN